MDRFRSVALFGVKLLFLCDLTFWLFEEEIEEEEEPSMALRWSSSSRDFLDFGLLLCVGVVRTRFLLLDIQLFVTSNEVMSHRSSFLLTASLLTVSLLMMVLKASWKQEQRRSEVSKLGLQKKSKLSALILSTLRRIFLKRLISRSRLALIRTLEILSPKRGSLLKCSTLLLKSVYIESHIHRRNLTLQCSLPFRSNHDHARGPAISRALLHCWYFNCKETARACVFERGNLL